MLARPANASKSVYFTLLIWGLVFFGVTIRAATISTTPFVRLDLGASEVIALQVNASGINIEYQWYRGPSGDTSQPVVGATGSLLIHPRFSATTSVWARVTDSSGSADSSAVEIAGTAAPAASLFSAGTNLYGQLGDGSSTDRFFPVWIDDEVASVSANGISSFFLKSDASLWAMGDNSSGQLGNGSTTSRNTPVNIATGVVSMATGSAHTFFLKADGSLWGSGGNFYGQLGIGSGSSQITPILISTGNAMACGGASHSLFLKVDGSLWSVGRNNYGQLGDGTTIDRVTPVKIASGVQFAAAGYAQTFFIKTDGTLWASGQNDRGQLGTGSVNSSGVSIPIQIATSVATVVATYSHTLFIKQDGSLWGMGDNSFGQLGREDISTYQATPVQLAANGITRIAANANKSFFLKSDGSLWAMGLNYYGEFGDGSKLTARRTPIQIASGVVDVATGSSHSLFTGTPRTVIFDLGTHGTGGGGALSQRVLRGAGAKAPDVIASSGWGFSGWDSSFDHVEEDVAVFARYEAAIAPAITSQPELIRAATGAAAALRITASGNFLEYQWYRGVSGDTSQPVVGANREVLVPTPFFISTRFWVRVSNSAGSADSQVILVEPQLASSARPASLFASGVNSYGQIGDGTTTARYTPVSVNADSVFVSAGVSHSFFIKPDGSLWAMGRNHKGQLGDGTTTSRSTPVKIADGVRAAAAGTEHSVFIKTDGSLWGMGSTVSGQLGTGSYTSALKTTPILIASDVASAAVNAGATLFVKLDGTLWGTGSSLSTPSPMQLAVGVSSITASDDHLMYVKTDGSLWAKGSNTQGQLGGGYPFGISLSAFTPVADDILAAAACALHSLFIKLDGTLLASGYNNVGQLGDGTRTRVNTPITIANDVTAVAAGSQHSLFRKADGSLWAAGDNSGQPFVGVSRWPLPTLLYPRVNTFAAGGASSLIVRATQLVTFDLGLYGTRTGGGTLSQWVDAGDAALAPNVTGTPEWGFAGWDASYSYVIADTALTARYEAVVSPVADVGPIRVDSGANGPLALQINPVGYYLTYQWYRGSSGDISQPITGATSALLVTNRLTTYASYWVRVSNDVGSADSPSLVVAAAINAHSELFANGANSYGQLGDGSLASRITPGKVADDIIAVSAGDTHSLFLGADGSLWAVGGNASGQLGDGSTTNRTIPVQVGADVVSISAGGSHSLFLKPDGTLWAMGLNTYGQLGDGSTTRRTSPVLVASNVAWMVAGLNNHSLFLKRNGTLWGMGSNLFGKLGLGVADNQAHPTPFQIDTDVLTVSAGDSHSLYLKRDGSLWGMGFSSSGQLAIPAPDNASYRPVPITTGVRAIAAGGKHSLFIKTDDALWGMGANSNGQLGFTDIGSKFAPIQIATGVKSVYAGEAHSFFVKAGGSLWAMGRNTSGELGNGSTLNQMTPTQIAARIDSVSPGDTHSLLTVPLVPDITFTSWMSATGITGVGAAADADPDYDGVPNLLEYTYGTNPLLSNVSDVLPYGFVETISNEQVLSFTHRRRKVTGLTYTYFTSDNLNTPTAWTPVAVIPSVINADVDGDGLIELVTVSVPLGSSQQRYLMLKVQE